MAASTQNQALSTVFVSLYRHVMRQEVCAVELLPRARMPSKVPVVLTVAEVRKVLDAHWCAPDRRDAALWRRGSTAGVP